MTNKLRTLGKMISLIENYPIYLKDYFGLKKGKYLIYKLRNGVKYRVRGGATDRFIINEICLHNSYTPEGFEIQEDDIVVDIGAHIGIFTILASRHAKKGKVYAFEPVSHNFELLKENISLNAANNVIAIEKAVSNKSGKMKLFISRSRNKGQNSMHRLDKYQIEIEVEKMSFKDFLKKLPKIDFLKMDCEGAEYEILMNLTKKELSKIKKISMEYHNYGEKKGKDLAKFLKENGFKVILKEKNFLFGHIYAMSEEEVK
ncbi:MAG: FkbM family methyltransferase [Nanoarchaeota archaeon]|nr:FkbM family methyltransferase [Nanoarchaeota archaeon]